MRVGLLIYGSLDTLSGGYLYDRVLVRHLRSQEVEVEILSLPWRKYPAHLLDNFKPSLYDDLNQLEVDVLIQDELNHPSLFRVNRKVRRSYPIISLVHHLRCDELRPTWQNHLYRQIEYRYLDSVELFQAFFRFDLCGNSVPPNAHLKELIDFGFGSDFTIGNFEYQIEKVLRQFLHAGVIQQASGIEVIPVSLSIK